MLQNLRCCCKVEFALTYLYLHLSPISNGPDIFSPLPRVTCIAGDIRYWITDLGKFDSCLSYFLFPIITFAQYKMHFCCCSHAAIQLVFKSCQIIEKHVFLHMNLRSDELDLLRCQKSWVAHGIRKVKGAIQLFIFFRQQMARGHFAAMTECRELMEWLVIGYCDYLGTSHTRW